jgi:hypothetical protein
MKLQSHQLFNSLSLALALAAGLLSTTRTEAAAIMGPNGNYYEVIRSGGISWDAANAEAQGLGDGWHLATVCDEAENEFINELRQLSQLGQVWLGGYQSPADEAGASAGWTWVNGEGPITTAFWEPGEPNDVGGAGSEQHLGLGLFGSSSWNDEGNLGNIHGYVVEKGPSRCAVPEGGASLGLLGLTLGGLFGLRRQLARR